MQLKGKIMQRVFVKEGGEGLRPRRNLQVRVNPRLTLKWDLEVWETFLEKSHMSSVPAAPERTAC